MHRRLPPLALVLYGSTLVALVPSQVLRFAYPVSDRYLFFPSVPFVLLVAGAALGAWRSGARPARRGRAVGALALGVLGAIWAWRAHAYLGEWSDPRSLWHAAARKVDDIYAHQYLGEHYQLAAERIRNRLVVGEPIEARDAALLARLGYGEDALALMRAEAARPLERRPMTARVQGDLLGRAWDELERAARLPQDRINPELFYNRAMNLLLRGQDADALEAFRRAWDEAERHPHDIIRWPYRARASYGMALALERRGELARALELMRRAREESARAGPSGLGDLTAAIARLEALAGQ
jgi:hypothetical protein